MKYITMYLFTIIVFIGCTEDEISNYKKESKEVPSIEKTIITKEPTNTPPERLTQTTITSFVSESENETTNVENNERNITQEELDDEAEEQEVETKREEENNDTLAFPKSPEELNDEAADEDESKVEFQEEENNDNEAVLPKNQEELDDEVSDSIEKEKEVQSPSQDN